MNINMNMNIKKAARLVFIPSFGVGHLASSIQFANLLVHRHDNLWITILKLPYDNSHAAAYTDSLNSPRLHLINLPEPSSNSMQTPIEEHLQLQKPLIKQAVSNLTPAPPLAAFVLDMFCITMIDVAKEFHVPSLVFFTSGLSYLALILHLYTLREEKGEFTEYGTEVVIPSFSNPVPATVLPFTVLNKEWDSFFVSFGGNLKKADGIIVNSFEELESHAAHSFLDGPQPIYPVGPILNYKPNTADAVTTDILNWLDQQPTSSVVFLCFGSMGSFGEDQVREIARALENSGTRFLWSLRKPSSTLPVFINPSDYAPSELPTVLPPGFLDRTAGIGKVIGWDPQTQILAHPATGGFVSHCGWNSTLESIHFGVPIAAWPLSSDQHINAFLLVHHLNIASEISFDYRLDFWARLNTLLTADCIEKGIRNLVEIDEDTRKRVKEASQNSRKTLLEGGSSHSNFGRLIDYIMYQV